MGNEGLEPLDSRIVVTGRDGIELRQTEQTADWQSGAHSGARSDAGVILADFDAGLSAIVAAWPKLSADARREVLAIVEQELDAAVGGQRGTMLTLR